MLTLRILRTPEMQVNTFSTVKTSLLKQFLQISFQLIHEAEVEVDFSLQQLVIMKGRESCDLSVAPLQLGLN
jgi:hypothetical protein